eukprot:CAMPEP_0194328254 /NCGR_PEP_ID=MMETSP0171-20130528/44069_1 /TAXON_ID=218684 /ORGANISM="Corethron pennatum, Strain L29A3" /LENGTH=50 /DNA_ID=CAMNT_0039088523 /DNA_START=10 /DNA_END=159 /DNA_ORIENTATION=-
MTVATPWPPYGTSVHPAPRERTWSPLGEPAGMSSRECTTTLTSDGSVWAS